MKQKLRNWGGVITLAALVALTLFAPLPAWGAAPEERHITVNARSFAFEPGTVRVNRGDTVVIRLESSDVVHGLFVDGYEVSAVAEPGRPAELRFTADRAGAFRMRCSVSCGNMHPFMIGKLVVGPNTAWLRAVAATLLTVIGAVVLFRNRTLT
jgi:heme/copper-type cytochrome/quinol oxidase subunit 2